jgi:hypothetical protein
MKRINQSKKLNFNKKVILLLNEQQKSRILAGIVTSLDQLCDSQAACSVDICTRTTVPRSCPSINACTTAPTDTCTK